MPSHILFLFIICSFELSNSEEFSKMSFSMPKLTEEEAESNHLPPVLECDACEAIMHQIKTAFSKKASQTKNKVLAESDVIEELETVCEKGFGGYGIKEVDGRHRLSGPGLETESKSGIVQGGGKWPKRIRDMCLVIVGDLGELKIYNAFRKKINLKNLFCDLYCIKKIKKKEL